MVSHPEPERIVSWRDFLVWQKAHAAVLEIYQVARAFSADERYRLSDQLCGAAASVPTNIAEGKGRGSRAEFRQFLPIARGSTEETRFLLLLGRDLGLIEPKTYADLEQRYTEVSKMTNALLRSLKP